MLFLLKTEIASQKWMIFLFFRILFLISGNNKLDQVDGIPEKVDVIPKIMDGIPNKLDVIPTKRCLFNHKTLFL